MVYIYMMGVQKHFSPLFVNIRHLKYNISCSKRVYPVKMKSHSAADKQRILWNINNYEEYNITFNYGRDYDCCFLCSVILW
jgi:hypothetical protein